MHESTLIPHTISFVKESLAGAEAGHDWFHIERVYNMSLKIAQEENADILIVSLGALLHDIADAKFHNGDETVGPKRTREFLSSVSLASNKIEHVVNIVKHISFKNSLDEHEEKFNSIELSVVQDADRLDAIGAIGIARAFNYGGYTNSVFYDPNQAPRLNMTKDEYKSYRGSTINHFYEKLLLLKDKMNTKSGKLIAQKRHEYMLTYLDQFYNEWDGRR